ncbi:MAG: 50S ribosomal protein L9 [Spirochaetota bacterium]
MKIILNQDIPNLGEEGDIREVANGYARNFLIPAKLAVLYNQQSLKVFEQRRDVIEKRKEEKRKQALGLKERIEVEEIVMEVPAGDTGKLFGSVTSATIAEELEKKGINIERKRIEVPEHSIKMIGTYNLKIKLYDKHTANLKVTIKASGQ